MQRAMMIDLVRTLPLLAIGIAVATSYGCAHGSSSVQSFRQSSNEAECDTVTYDSWNRLLRVAASADRARIAEMALDRYDQHSPLGRARSLLAYALSPKVDERWTRESLGNLEWFVEYCHRARVLESPLLAWALQIHASTSAQQHIVPAWRRQVRKHSGDVTTLSNAALFLGFDSRTRSEALNLLRAALSVQPRRDLVLRRGLLLLQSSWVPDSDRDAPLELSKAAIDDVAYVLSGRLGSEMEMWLLDHAQTIILATATDDESVRNALLHYGHTFKGYLALHRSDISSARQELLLAASTTGPAMPSGFAPSQALANALLELGERGAVIEYLRLWKVAGINKDLYETWMREIEAGSRNTIAPR